MKITKISLIIAIAGIVAISQAQTFSFTTAEVGTFVGTEPASVDTVKDTFSVTGTQSSSSLFSFTSGTNNYYYDENNNSNFSGVFSLVGPTAADTMTFDYDGYSYWEGATAISFLFDTYVASATGIYAGLTGYGNGTDQLVITNPTNYTGTSGGYFTANLQAVPAPAGIFALALGGFGLLVRRRRS